MQSDNLIPAGKPDLVLIMKTAAEHRVNSKESEQIDKYLDLARELKKNGEDESDCYYYYSW